MEGLGFEGNPMTGAWGWHAAADLRAVEDPTGRTLEAAWGRPPMVRGRVRDGDPTVGSWGGCLAVEELVGIAPTGETL